MSGYIPIAVGEFANDGTGDNLRTAFQKINANFANVSGNGNLANVAFSFPSGVGTLDQGLISYGNGATFWGTFSSIQPINYTMANAHPVIDLSISNKQFITLTSNVSSSIAINGVDGIEYTFLIEQGVTGNFSWSWPNNFAGAGNISIGNVNTSPNTYSTQKFLYANISNIFYGTTPLVTSGN